MVDEAERGRMLREEGRRWAEAFRGGDEEDTERSDNEEVGLAA